MEDPGFRKCKIGELSFFVVSIKGLYAKSVKLTKQKVEISLF